ncbi:hypothetical protein [Plastoroseomonas hellenica]|uniref:Uncharacterized protein n=1 Tax=Plastoroseomonas hellenica TaxID=2687306 RepID=A0ABS5F503_9PROT|nr:hypothetical protein [Plastoroseomonas hellenica]MBR0645312.1 hypothetical protein [Plastoroseomonas hellenica]MBR0667653.1 hypothetical protein [Plastoroseomonas hellenica]
MADKIPPVPPANQSHKGPGEGDRKSAEAEALRKPPTKAAEQRGRQDNKQQNTTHPGLQQDR